VLLEDLEHIKAIREEGPLIADHLIDDSDGSPGYPGHAEYERKFFLE
jgi:hypothetical protein